MKHTFNSISVISVDHMESVWCLCFLSGMNAWTNKELGKCSLVTLMFMKCQDLLLDIAISSFMSNYQTF